MSNLKTSVTRNREVYLILAISLGFVALLAFGRLWGWLLEEQILRENERDLISGILTRLPILVMALYFLKKSGFQRFAGIGYWGNIQQVQAVLIPAVIIAMGFLGSLQVYLDAGAWLLSLFIVNTLLVALIEEFTFRGLILPLIIKLRKRKKSMLFVSVCLASGIFGLLHYMNLFKEPDNFWGITSQVLFAFSIGVFLGGLLLRTRHILFPVFIHFFVNFSFGNGELKEQVEEVIDADPVANELDLGSLITLAFFAFMIVGAWYMIKQVDRSYVLETLDITENKL